MSATLLSLSQELPPYAKFQIPYKSQRLNDLRQVGLEEKALNLQKRIFELNIQHLYTPLIKGLSSKEIGVLGMVHNDGSGDLYHIRFAADVIQKKFPHLKIRIMPFFMDDQQMKRFESCKEPGFENDFYFYNNVPKEGFEKIKNASFVLEISQPIPVDELEDIRKQLGEKFYFVGEYGDWRNPAMGFGPEDEGIFIKRFIKTSLCELKNTQLKTVLFGSEEPSEQDLEKYHQEHALFFGYLKMSHLFQLGFFYSVIMFQSKDSKTLDLVMPIENLKQLDEWKLIDRKFLKEQGIRRITLIKKSEEQSIEISDEGKVVRLINPFPLIQKDFHLLGMNSKFLKGCTGDQSFTEMMAEIIDKAKSKENFSLFFYEICTHKLGFFRQLKSLVEDLCGKGDFYNYLDDLEKFYCHAAAQIFERPESFRASEVSNFMQSVLPTIVETSKKIGLLLATSSSLQQEVCKVRAFIRTHFSFNENLEDLVAHRLAIYAYPDLKNCEEGLYQEYCAGTKNLCQIHEIMKDKISSL